MTNLITNVPKGYSANCYPNIFKNATHRVISSSRIPVYKSFSEKDVIFSPSENQDDLHSFLEPNSEITVIDENIGYNGNWSEIYIISDENSSSYNLFIYNPSGNEVVERLDGIQPSMETVDGFKTRDYMSPIISYDSKPENIVFYDEIYKHYVVKIVKDVDSNRSTESMLKEALVDGSRKITDSYSITLPEYSAEYLANGFFDSFRIIDYKIDIRGNTNLNTIKLISYVAIKSKYLDNLFPSVMPSTEEISSQEPQYRITRGEGTTRVNEYLDPWLDPVDSPFSSDDFLRQYFTKYKKEDGDYNFENELRGLKARGTETPANILDIIKDELSGSIYDDSYLRNEQDNAVSNRSLAQENLENAIDEKLENMFDYLGITPERTRKYREFISSLTNQFISTGAGIEDVNDILSSISNSLSTTPDIINGEISGEDLVASISSGIADNSPGIMSERVKSLSDNQAKETISQAKQNNRAFGDYFYEDASSGNYNIKMPLELDREDHFYNYTHDQLVIKRKNSLEEVLKHFKDSVRLLDFQLAGREIFHTKMGEDEDWLDAPDEYRIYVESVFENFFGIDWNDLQTKVLINWFRESSRKLGSPSPIIDILSSEDSIYYEIKYLGDTLGERTISLSNFYTPPTNLEGIFKRVAKNLSDAFKKLENTLKIENDKPYLTENDYTRISEIASETIYQSVVEMRNAEVTANDVTYGSLSSGTTKEFTQYSALSEFYHDVVKSIDEIELDNWKVKKLNKSRVKSIEKNVNLIMKTILVSLLKIFNPELVESKKIEFANLKVELNYDKDFRPIFVRFSGYCTTTSENIRVTSFSGAENEKYDIEKVLSRISPDKQSLMHLCFTELQNYKKDLHKSFPAGGYEFLSVKPKKSETWKNMIADFFPFPQVDFELNETNLESSGERSFYQNTKGRTKSQRKRIVRNISKASGESQESQQSRVDNLEENPVTEVVYQAGAAIARSGNSIDNFRPGSTSELMEDLLSQFTDNPVVMMIAECLIPSISLTKLVQDNEQYKALKETADSLLAAAEAAGAAMDLYDTIDSAFSGEEGEKTTSQQFSELLIKALDILILETYKRTMEYIQVLCLQWQAFLMDAITNSLIGDALEDGEQIPGSTEPTSIISGNVLQQMALKGYSSDEVRSLSSPTAVKYIEDLSILLSPSEFCQLMTKDDAPENLKDIAFGLYENLYSETELRNIQTKNKLYDFLRMIGKYIDPSVCEALSDLGRFPEIGYSHTVKSCSDNTSLQNVREQIINQNLKNSEDEIRQILDNTASRENENFKHMLSEIGSSPLNSVDMTIDQDEIYNSIPAVKEDRKIISELKNGDLLNALSIDKDNFCLHMKNSGKESYEIDYRLLDIGPMGHIHRVLIEANLYSKLRLIDYRINEGNLSAELNSYLSRVLEKDSSGKYINNLDNIAKNMSERYVLEFTKQELEMIRLAEVRLPIQPFVNLNSEVYEFVSEGVENIDPMFVISQAKNDFLQKLKEELNRYTDNELRRLIEALVVRPWKPKIGIYDIESNINVYYTSQEYDQDYVNQLEGLRTISMSSNNPVAAAQYKEMIDAYEEEFENGDYNDEAAILNAFGNPSTDQNYPLAYEGSKIDADNKPTPEKLYEWLENETNRQAELFSSMYEEEENSGGWIPSKCVILARPLSDLVINQKFLTEPNDIKLVKAGGYGPRGSPWSIDYNGNIYYKEDVDKSKSKQTIMPIGLFNKDSNISFGQRPLYTFYTDNGESFLWSQISNSNYITSHVQKLDTKFSNKSFVSNDIEKKMRNLSDNVFKDLFIKRLPDNIENTVDLGLISLRNTIHAIGLQSKWTRQYYNDLMYNKQISELFDTISRNFVEKDGDKLVNKYPDLINEHFDKISLVKEIISENSMVRNRFKSPVDFLNKPNISIERRDYSIDEKVDIWISIKSFISSFVTEYYLKMIPVIVSTNSLTDSQVEISKKIIIKNIETFLSKERGDDFDIFRKKFLYLSNSIFLYLKQEKCSNIDISEYDNIHYAVEEIIDELVNKVVSYLKQTEIVKSASTLRTPLTRIINTKNYINYTQEPYSGKVSFLDTTKNQNRDFIWKLTRLREEQLFTGDEHISDYYEAKRDIRYYGMFYIDYTPISISNHDGTTKIITNPDNITHETRDEIDPDYIVDENNYEKINVQYKVRARLRYIMPESRSLTPEVIHSGEPSKTPIYNGLERENTKGSTDSTFIIYDIVDTVSDISFYNPMNPNNDGVSIFDMPRESGDEYLKGFSGRYRLAIDEAFSKIESSAFYRDIDSAISMFCTEPDNNIIVDLIYYTMYNNFYGLGAQETFSNLREASITKLLKADARGTPQVPIRLFNKDINETGPDVTQTGAVTFYEYYTKPEQQQEHVIVNQQTAGQTAVEVFLSQNDTDGDGLDDVSGQEITDDQEKQVNLCAQIQHLNERLDTEELTRDEYRQINDEIELLRNQIDSMNLSCGDESPTPTNNNTVNGNQSTLGTVQPE